MAVKFIPEIWSNEIYDDLDESLVAINLTNQDYEGEIREKGDTVHIVTPGDVTVKDYTGAPIDAPEEPDDADTIMTINQAKYFNVKVTKIDRVQQKVDLMRKYIKKGGQGCRKSADTYILNQYVNIPAGNILTPTVQIDESNIHENFALMSEIFDVNNVPDDERSVVVPPRIMLIFKKFFAGKQTEFGNQVARNGYQGNFDNWQVFKSNNVPKVQEDILGDTVIRDVYKITFGHKSGITFAYQIPIDEIEYYKPENDFGNAIKALCLFDCKMMDGGKRNGLFNFWL